MNAASPIEANGRTGVLRSLLGDSGETESLSVIVLEELLAPPALEWVSKHVLEQDAHMTESRVLSDPGFGDGTLLDTGSRRSRLLFAPDPTLVALLRSQLRRVLPDVLVRMGHTIVEPTEVDVQLTVHENGGYFRSHADASDAVHNDRRLSYVFFCHREPTAFTGGHLQIDVPGRAAGVVDVQPVANRLALFPSRWRHQVTDVSVRSRRFADSRFTVNGWLHW